MIEDIEWDVAERFNGLRKELERFPLALIDDGGGGGDGRLGIGILGGGPAGRAVAEE